jgi:hypothetical protein
MHAVEGLIYARPGLPVQADYLDGDTTKKFTVETFVFMLPPDAKDAAVPAELRHTNEERATRTGGKRQWSALKVTSDSLRRIALDNFHPDDLHQCKYRSIEA